MWNDSYEGKSHVKIMYLCLKNNIQILTMKASRVKNHV